LAFSVEGSAEAFGEIMTDRDEYGLSAEQKEVWRQVQKYQQRDYEMCLADAVVHLLAVVMLQRHGWTGAESLFEARRHLEGE
jgi:hypothetical protein